MRLNLLIILLLVWRLNAQDSCKMMLYNLSEDYRWGKIEHIESQMLNCISNFSKNQKIEAYKLLCLRFIHDQQLDQAKIYLLKWLKLDPKVDIQSFQNTSLDLIYKDVDNQVYESFYMGFNYNFGILHVLKLYSLRGEDKSIRYKNPINFCVKGAYIRKLNKRWYLGTGLSYLLKETTFEESYQAYALIQGKIQKHYLQWNLNTQLRREFRKHTFYLGFGCLVPIKLNSNGSFKRIDQLEGGQNRVLELKNYNLKKEVNGANLGLEFSANFEFPFLKKHSIGVELMIQSYLFTWNSKPNRYYNTKLIFDFYKVPDDFLISHLGLAVFIKINNYKPKFI